MLYLLSEANNPIIYVLIVLLIIVVIAIFYLVYTQHKEMVKVFSQNNNDNIIKSTKADINLENTIANIELPRVKEDNELIVKEDALLPKVDTDIPDKFDYTQALWQKDELDLEMLSQKLENRDNTKKSIDSYEEEQEEQAIISYDELKRKSLSEEKIELPTKKKIVSETEFGNYEHEELFLSNLKKLKSILK